MKNADELVTRTGGKSTPFCLAKEAEIFVVYLPEGGSAELKIQEDAGYTVHLFNPREGGALKAMAAQERGNQLLLQSPGESTNEDWLFVVRRTNAVIAK